MGNDPEDGRVSLARKPHHTQRGEEAAGEEQPVQWRALTAEKPVMP